MKRMIVPQSLFAGLALVAFLAVEAKAAEPASASAGIVKVAAVQISGYDKGDLPRQGYHPEKQMVPYIDRAGADGAELVVFPEYVLGRIRVPGPESQVIADAAKQNGVYVIVGCWELLDGDAFANTALLFGRDGKIVGRYRKTHAAVDHFDPDRKPWERPQPDRTRSWMVENDPEWIMQKGQSFPVFDLDFGRVGIMTCYDGWFPEPPRILSLKGAEIVVWINGRGGNVEDFIVRSIMFQSHVSVIATNQAYGGGTLIGDGSRARGGALQRCPDRQESYVTAELNLARLRQIRDRSRNFRQRRPDLYGELVKTPK